MFLKNPIILLISCHWLNLIKILILGLFKNSQFYLETCFWHCFVLRDTVFGFWCFKPYLTFDFPKRGLFFLETACKLSF